MKSFGVEKNQSFGYISGPDLLDYQNIRFLIHGIIDISTHQIGRTNPEIVFHFKHKYPPVTKMATRPVLIIKLNDSMRGIHLKLRPTYKRFMNWDGVFENVRNDAILGYSQNGYQLTEIDFDYKVPILNVIKEKIVYKEVEKPVYMEVPFIDALKKENKRLHEMLSDFRIKDDLGVDNPSNLVKMSA